MCFRNVGQDVLPHMTLEDEVTEGAIRPFDILWRSRREPTQQVGNRILRQVIRAMKPTYRAIEDNALKAEIPTAIVLFLQFHFHARFVKKGSTESTYRVMSLKESRDKTAQAPRE